MYSAYQDRDELEDDLYREDDDSDVSEANSELEFHLYSQLHYSSNAGEMEDLEAGAEQKEKHESQKRQRGDAPEKTSDGDPESKCIKPCKPASSTYDRSKTKKVGKNKKAEINPKIQKLSSSHFEEVIVIDSSPGVISISDDSGDEDDSGVCALKGQGSRKLQTSTPAQQVEKMATCVHSYSLNSKYIFPLYIAFSSQLFQVYSS